MNMIKIDSFSSALVRHTHNRSQFCGLIYEDVCAVAKNFMTIGISRCNQELP